MLICNTNLYILIISKKCNNKIKYITDIKRNHIDFNIVHKIGNFTFLVIIHIGNNFKFSVCIACNYTGSHRSRYTFQMPCIRNNHTLYIFYYTSAGFNKHFFWQFAKYFPCLCRRISQRYRFRTSHSRYKLVF